MTTNPTPFLRGLSMRGLTVTDHGADVRGDRVFDKSGNDIGEVDDPIVEDGKRTVCFLRVAAGGFLGLGETKFLIPIEAVASIDGSTVHIDRTRDHVANGPRYDPALGNRPQHLNEVYVHYGFAH